MSVVSTLELSSNDPAALCLIFVEGQLAAMERGAASAPVHAGAHVRWFVRPGSKRNPNVTVVQRLEGAERLLFEGRCEGGLGSGVVVSERMRRRRKLTVAAAAAPAPRITRAAAREPGRKARATEVRGPIRSTPRAAPVKGRRGRR